MSHHFRVHPAEGYTPIVTPGQGELKYIEFGLLNLLPGASYAGATADCEAVLVLLSGDAIVRCDDGEPWALRRAGIFEEPASGAYIPPDAQFAVETPSGLLAALAFAPSDGGFPARAITPADVSIAVRGSVPFLRRVHDIATGQFPAGRLLVGETFNEPGQWSSYPPHKHDEHNPPVESVAEEVYYFRVDPQQGFGLQWLYANDGALDEAYAVRDGDIVTLPRGYHPVAAAPGYKLYYLWILAGPQRVMQPNDDPAHAWVKANPQGMPR